MEVGRDMEKLNVVLFFIGDYDSFTPVLFVR